MSLDQAFADQKKREAEAAESRETEKAAACQAQEKAAQELRENAADLERCLREGYDAIVQKVFPQLQNDYRASQHFICPTSLAIYFQKGGPVHHMPGLSARYELKFIGDHSNAEVTVARKDNRASAEEIVGGFKSDTLSPDRAVSIFEDFVEWALKREPV